MRILPFIFAGLLSVSAYGADYKYWEEPNDTPFLENIGTPPPCDYTITNAAGWANVNNASYRVICVAPGDYTSVGTITLTADGTVGAKRWLRYYNTAVSDSLHPYHMTLAQRAIVRNITMSDADHWIIDRLSFDGTGTAYATNILFLTNGSSYNTINKIDMRDIFGGVTLHNGSSYNVIQKSTIHDSWKDENAAILLHSWNYDGNHPLAMSQYNRVVSNEIWDVGDSFQALGQYDTPEEEYNGTVVYNNDMYITPARYTDCNDVSSTTGLCAWSEGALDIKSGSGSALAPMVLAHNRMWGFRYAEQANGSVSTGMSDTGTCLVVHQDSYNVAVHGNIAWDCMRGLNFGGNELTNIDIAFNLIHQLPPENYNGTWGTDTIQMYVGPSTPVNVTVRGNVLSQNTPLPRKSIIFAYAGATSTAITFSNNAIIDGVGFTPATGTFAGTVSGNQYIESTKPSWDASPAINIAESDGSVYDNEFCTTIKRITAPEQKCFAKAIHDDNVAVVVPGTPNRPTQWRILD